MGWCDDPQSPRYNMLVRFPYRRYSAERLWRADTLYDILIILGINDKKIIKKKGSALFIHLAQPHRQHTHGCVALDRRNMLHLIATLRCHSSLHSHAPPHKDKRQRLHACHKSP
ncbi:MAG: L,D-transpeptidase family protein [Alphaproteobacteria bacterium GM7ARS4]|nr:L,D-transpeptidase family protein [Alphaproteobacteria bacterium GM7ARS4]